MRRSTTSELNRTAADDLRRVLADLGVAAQGLDVDGRAVVDADNWDHFSHPGTVVVADIVTEAARQALDEAGRSWWDRRGRLHLNEPGLVVRSDDTAFPRTATTSGPAPDIAGTALDVALDALLSPHGSVGVRELARRLGVAASSVSRARRALTQRGLLETNGTPAGIHLFWAVADGWSSVASTTRLGTVPPPSCGVVVDAGAAAVAGVSIATVGMTPPALIADRDTEADLRFTDATDGDGVATVATAASMLALTGHPDGLRGPQGHLIAHPVILALALASDPARGAEAIRDWTPEGCDRVW